MGGASKLRKLSCETTQCVSDQRDFFTELPDFVIHHIFSFLGVNDLARLSILARRLQQLSITSPYLKFAFQNHGADDCCYFTKFMTSLLELRDNMKIQRFHLHWSCHQNQDHRHKCCHVEKWIKDAITCNMEELLLNLRLHVDFSYKLPHCLFNSQSIKVLHLKLGGDKLEVPCINFASLETLLLDSILVPDSNSIGIWVSNFCPSLKSLTLKKIGGEKELRIHSSSLEDLKIYTREFFDFCHISISTMKLQNLYLKFSYISRRFYRYAIQYSVEIFAPNIQSLTWTGAARKFSYSGELKELRNATLDLKQTNRGSIESPWLLQIMSCVRWTRALDINCWILRALPKNTAILFENLCHLSFMIKKIDDVPCIVSFMNGLVHLQTLHIRQKRTFVYCHNSRIQEDDHDSDISDDNNSDGYESNDLDCSSSTEKEKYQGDRWLLRLVDSQLHKKDEKLWQTSLRSIHGLKEVKIELTTLRREIFLVIHGVMKYGKDLEKIIITYPSYYEHSISRIGIQNFEKAASFAVVLLPKDIL